MENNDKNIIDLGEIFKTLLAKKKTFFIIWSIVFALSCLWILPQPRFYTCEVSLAPETSGEDVASGLGGLASNFGINLGGAGNDAIYPTLYPDLFTSNQFVVSLFNIKVTTLDGSLTTDYYTYLAKHQKKNWLLNPFYQMISHIKKALSDKSKGKPGNAKELNPFQLSEFDFELTERVKSMISCNVNKKTDVITITVKDQDPLICASLADSIRVRLQEHIIEYRTKKTRIDAEHYQHLTDSANMEYRSAVNEYAQFCDANQDLILQSQQSKRDELENEMQMCYNTYQAMKTQLEATKAKLQERTPAFTTLKSATVPIKPAGPKRMFFVASMLILATIISVIWFNHGEMKKLFEAK
ncbi:MAG: chain-length determining protein [Prevotella sp.]|nr:chain-length determining protein [Candidatus Prevotella equi]